MSVSEAPKYLRLSRTLEEQIADGNWGDRLPSLRGLAESHGVSVVTVARAVQVLRDKGLIGRTDNSGCYITRPGTDAEVALFGVCLRVTPTRWQQYSGAILRAGFEEVAARGLATFREAFDLSDGITLGQMREQVRAALDDGMLGAFLEPARHNEDWAAQDERFLEACDLEGLPVVLLERNLRGHLRELTHDLVAVDDFDGGVRCTRHLLDLGRKSPTIAIASPCSSHDNRIAGYLFALHLAAEQDLDVRPVVLRLPAGLPPKAAERWLADRLLEAGADAVVCYQDYVAVGLIVELLSRGVTVPGQIAVCGFEDLPIGDLFTVGVTTYRYPSRAMVEAGMRLLQHRGTGSGPPQTVSIRGELIIRESTVGPRPL